MSDLVTFLLAQLDADEAAADELHDRNCSSVQEGSQYGPCDCGYPARVLAEVAAKRVIVEAVASGFYDSDLGVALRALAAVYEGAPGWQEEWR